AQVSLDNNDEDENPYTITVEGDAYGTSTAEPDIILKQDSNEIQNGGSYDFGTVQVGYQSAPVSFSIENTGTEDLQIESAGLTGGDTGDFQVDTSELSSTLAPGSSTSFSVTFVPQANGPRSADFTIRSNDPDEDPYSFSLSGTGSSTGVCDINVKQGSTNIPSGTGTYDFGTVEVNSFATATFTIENTGTADLSIGEISLTSGDTGQFSIDTSSMDTTVQPGGRTYFDISFAPTSSGSKSSTVSIKNNDPDENPYTFTVEGSGSSSPVPDINLRVEQTSYPSGSSYDFGSVQVGSSSKVLFYIENEGTEDLEITNILLTKGDRSDFSLDLSSTSYTISPGGSTSFKAVFTPQAAGERGRNLDINNNDSDENPYKLELTGFGVK
ncbi:MAG: choice-of-anchor D domain-containing protein, partial [Spirochaetota bacterium]